MVNTDGSVKMRIYKYISTSVIDYNDYIVRNKTVVPVLFNSRSYIDVPLPSVIVYGGDEVFQWQAALNSINPDIAVQWLADTDFTTMCRLLVVSYNTNSLKAILPLLMSSPTDASIKSTVVTRIPLINLNDKMGLPLIKINADGNIIAPMVSTETVMINTFNRDDDLSVVGGQIVNYAATSSVVAYNNATNTN